MNKWILALLTLACTAHAGRPLWTLTPLTSTSVSVPTNGTAIIKYRVTNVSKNTRSLSVSPITGIHQDTTNIYCKNPFILPSEYSCTLKLDVSGNQLLSNITSGPIVCDSTSKGLQCYQPSSGDQLSIKLVPAITTAILSIEGSPLYLVRNGAAGYITVENTSSELSATNVTANLTGTNLQNNVSVDASQCRNIAPSSSCHLIFTPINGGSLVSTNNTFPIQGTNTSSVNAQVFVRTNQEFTSISPTSSTVAGGTGITLTGKGFNDPTGTTTVTIGGSNATFVNLVNSTTITAVTPAHGAGTFDVTITTPSGTSTLNNAYTYAASQIGQPTGGGVIACLNAGNNLIAATQDNGITGYGGMGVYINNANSNTNGAANTDAIWSELFIFYDTYAALLCKIYEIDSAGNTPCEAGNRCYNDWFLAAGNNQTNSGQMWCLYQNRAQIGNFSNVNYWSSTQYDANYAWYTSFYANTEAFGQKTQTPPFYLNVRCVRAFTP
jgi:hypothetical protein